MSANLNTNLRQLHERIVHALAKAGRPATATTLLAVSKHQAAPAVAHLASLGQSAFGESYLQEALVKIAALSNVTAAGTPLEWHFIGPLQSNKCRDIAAHFSWVESVDRLKVAERLNQLRPAHLPPLNILLQVNISKEQRKSGCTPQSLPTLAAAVAALPRLQLRGLMAIPAATDDPLKQRHAFRELAIAQQQLIDAGYPLDTLSMGMSDDLEAAIAEGSTQVRVGTALFGARD
ncbi:MAG: YggS family pyridoxal phosphate-dependent enzyme [Gammaproteobacteria bacterium]|nr:YggS family pyridoxal phosphate-dependent enzyme [Gammaproteobacteria bacterium]